MSIEPWQWPEETWRTMVGRARAGRSLKPATWPGGARCAVAISFDADHETIPLRDSDESPMRISQGQYGNRQAMPRIRRLGNRIYAAVLGLLSNRCVSDTASGMRVIRRDLARQNSAAVLPAATVGNATSATS